MLCPSKHTKHELEECYGADPIDYRAVGLLSDFYGVTVSGNGRHKMLSCPHTL